MYTRRYRTKNVDWSQTSEEGNGFLGTGPRREAVLDINNLKCSESTMGLFTFLGKFKSISPKRIGFAFRRSTKMS